ncbi:hypothetical protein RRG08_045166 [Elysia crispata]|uniref:Uncharacterized protein n=1 Tax=Elysia crispata TaxID=231223 RepID=A0AAE1AEW3_9GAST|nr:hypothetical protein RRG08_045166 [Elysia crispata]
MLRESERWNLVEHLRRGGEGAVESERLVGAVNTAHIGRAYCGLISANSSEWHPELFLMAYRTLPSGIQSPSLCELTQFSRPVVLNDFGWWMQLSRDVIRSASGRDKTHAHLPTHSLPPKSVRVTPPSYLPHHRSAVLFRFRGKLVYWAMAVTSSPPIRTFHSAETLLIGILSDQPDLDQSRLNTQKSRATSQDNASGYTYVYGTGNGRARDPLVTRMFQTLRRARIPCSASHRTVWVCIVSDLTRMIVGLHDSSSGYNTSRSLRNVSIVHMTYRGARRVRVEG